MQKCILSLGKRRDSIFGRFCYSITTKLFALLFLCEFFFAFIYYCSFVFTLGVSFVFFTSQETWPWPLMDWGLMGGSFGLPLGSRMGLFSLSFLFQRNFRMLSILPSSLSHRNSSFGGHIHFVRCSSLSTMSTLGNRQGDNDADDTPQCQQAKPEREQNGA